MSIVWKEFDFFTENKFRANGKIYSTDKNGFWYLDPQTLCIDKPWINEKGEVCGATIDPKIKEEIEKLNEAQGLDMWRLDQLSKDPTVCAYSFPSKAYVKIIVSPCSHINYCQRAKGYVCSQCCKYEIVGRKKSIVDRSTDE